MQPTSPTATTAKPTEVQHLTSGMRTAYALLGVVALVFAVILLASPFLSGYFATFVLYIFVVIALLVMGISDIVASTSTPEASSGLRTLRLILGVLIILFAFVALIDVYFAFVVLWIFVGLGLLFQGMFLLFGVGASDQLEGWQRGMGTALGVIDIVFAFLVLLIPVFAFILVWILIAVAVIAAAIYLLTIASSGVKRAMPQIFNVPGLMPPTGGTGPMSPPPPAAPPR
jgi:uncharacterized membrane protein HdeD (DUF308 family)